MEPIQLSNHFNSGEFFGRSRRGGPLDVPVPREFMPNLKRLVSGGLEPLRVAYGAPIIVVSGYRPPSYNASIGGALKSQHLTASAADIRPVVQTEREVARLLRLIENMIADGELKQLGGLGVYPTFLHLDVRQRRRDGSVTRWSKGGE